ncbi:hypothetical protein J41TS12_06190 [Paenibacillus antibioticophila]|uniref:Uncharacterized protein n=1 Tax=Paenibacillus antibioticophila TaxID=1274374 RepID=A0A920CFE7_9BACL|nr:hypothetical protein [Paenibacillus antibioticophila]GIO35758.1 hypothetical protein J41TS12_06190 [Paenibacillus antibioticophila]
MIEKKNLYIANFNCTYSKNKKNEPLLSNFETILLPAFTHGIIYKNSKTGNEFLFEDVELSLRNGIFVLVGLIVKRTHLEIKTRYNESGALITTNDLIPSDPFSYFIINLQNHRMVLVKNQKGSPTVSDFDKTASHILSMYVREYNKLVSESENKLPKPNLNVVTIPYSGKIEEELKKIKKIESAVLRFYPLNGDISTNELFNELREMLDEVDSKTGSTQFNNPQDHGKIAEILKDTKGTVRPTLRVIYGNGSKRTLRENDFSEVTKVDLDDTSSFHDNMNEISGKVINQPQYNETSEENNSIYQRYFSKLENIFKSKLEEK